MVEQVEPKLVDEMFWRTVSLRPCPANDDENRYFGRIDEGPLAAMAVAAMLARYDRATGGEIFAEALEFVPRRRWCLACWTFAVVDPKQIPAALEASSIQIDRSEVTCMAAYALCLDEASLDRQLHRGSWLNGGHGSSPSWDRRILLAPEAEADRPDRPEPIHVGSEAPSDGPASSETCPADPDGSDEMEVQ
jgi:hypothetical protein